MREATGSLVRRCLMLAAVLAVAALAATTAWLAARTNELELRLALFEQRQDTERPSPPNDSAEAEHWRLVLLQNPPIDSYEVFAVAKQWMWKFQHPNGQREVGELHLPSGRPVKLTIISEDVFHRLDVPALGIKADAIPGQYTTAWGKLAKIGRHPFSCGQYCGAHHAQHTGTLIVMAPVDFDRWLDSLQSDPKLRTSDAKLAIAGQQAFMRGQCIVCHSGEKGAYGPSLEGRFGGQSKLRGGTTIDFDEEHVRESIRAPKTKVAEGFDPLMPAYHDGLLGEEGLTALVEFLRTLKVGDLAKMRHVPALNERLERIDPLNQDLPKIEQPRLEGLKRK